MTLGSASFERRLGRGSRLPRPLRSVRPVGVSTDSACGALGPEPLGLGSELFEPAAQLVGRGVVARRRSLSLRSADRCGPTAARRAPRRRHWPPSLHRRRRPSASVTRSRSPRNACFVGVECLGVGCDLLERGDDLVEFGAEPGAVGFEVGDHARVEQLAVVAFERTLAFGEDAGEAAGALAELLDLHQPVADVVSPRAVRSDSIDMISVSSRASSDFRSRPRCVRHRRGRRRWSRASCAARRSRGRRRTPAVR